MLYCTILRKYSPPSDVKSVTSGTSALKLSLGGWRWLINEYAARSESEQDRNVSRFKFPDKAQTIFDGGTAHKKSLNFRAFQKSRRIDARVLRSLSSSRLVSQSWQIGGMHNKLSLIQSPQEFPLLLLSPMLSQNAPFFEWK